MDNAVRTVSFAQPVQVTPGARYALVLASPDGAPGSAVTAWQGSTIAAARAEIPVEIQDRLLVNGEARDGMLHFSFRMRSYLWFGISGSAHCTGTSFWGRDLWRQDTASGFAAPRGRAGTACPCG